jgi:hypothetical protein
MRDNHHRNVSCSHSGLTVVTYDINAKLGEKRFGSSTGYLKHYFLR